MNWKWTKQSPPVHILCSVLWEDNYINLIYEIYDKFIGANYFMLYKKDAPSFYEQDKSLVSTMGDWYIGEYFTYIRIWGSMPVHLLPRIVPDKMVLEEVSY